jgi:hypothetical protein
MARKLRNRLALAHFKAKKGWEDLNLDLIEPKIDEELRRKRPSSSGDIQSDSSSSVSDFQYPRGLISSSPLKEPIFSDAIGSSSGSSGHRKRTYHSSFQHQSSSSTSHKRFRSSPTTSRSFSSGQAIWKDNHQLAHSSPIKPRKHSHFTTSAGPDISLFRGRSDVPDVQHSRNYMAGSGDEDDLLPAHSFKMNSMEIRSSPPRTPPPVRNRTGLGRRNNGKNTSGKSGEEGADLLLYLATSPSPANPTGRSRMQPPSTPPPRNNLPSSMMTTPGGTALLSAFGGPNTPSQTFDFSDFVNITPSPAQNAWPKTPAALRTPLTVARRRLTFENNFLGSPDMSPHGSNTAKQTGLGMQLGGELLS